MVLLRRRRRHPSTSNAKTFCFLERPDTMSTPPFTQILASRYQIFHYPVKFLFRTFCPCKQSFSHGFAQLKLFIFCPLPSPKWSLCSMPQFADFRFLPNR